MAGYHCEIYVPSFGSFQDIGGWRISTTRMEKPTGYIIFDVKMDFTRKSKWVKDGHHTPDPETSSYAQVFSRENIRIALTTGAFQGVYVLAADIRNAYLQAPSSYKHFIICGLEFGFRHKGKK